MSKSIGSESVDLIYGIPQTNRPTVEMWEVPGLDGFGAIQNGSRSPVTPMKTVKFVADNTAAALHGSNMIAMTGTIVTVSTDFSSDNFQNVMIVDVQTPRYKKGVIKDGSAGIRCEIDLLVRSTQ